MHTTQRRLIGVLAAGTCALLSLTTTAATAATGHGATDRAAKATSKHGGGHQPGHGPGHKPRHKPRHKPGYLVPVQLLSFNDFHGNLEPPSGSSGRNVVGHTFDPVTGKPVDTTVNAGGAAYLATHLAQARQGHPNSLTVAAGDIIGASPLLSAAFHDEPTIESMNKLGLDVTSVGNHEFDEGYKELQRMARGGCIDDGPAGRDNQNSCADHRFRGADFDMLAANVKYAGTNTSILPSYTIKKLHGAKIGFIGMTLKGTPDIVTAAGVAGLEFTDEVTTANALVPVLKRQGVNAIVVLIHQGGTPTSQQLTNPADGKTYAANPTYDYTCSQGGSLAEDSAILPIARNLDPAIDMVVSGHTHQPYVCDVEDPRGQDRLVTSASSFGRLYTETDLTYDRRTRDIVRSSVKGANLQVTRDVPADPAQAALISLYTKLVAPIANKVVGRITTDVTRTPNAAGETPLGDLIADAQLADPSVVTGGQKPVIAFMNPGGIRADLSYAPAPGKTDAPGEVTYEEAFTVQPFNNYLVSMTLTGEQIYQLLAQQVTGTNAGTNNKILQVSKGFAYRLGSDGAVPGSVTLDGTPVDRAATYRIVTNNFLSDGGDGFKAFTGGTGKYFGGLDIDGFAGYLTASSPYTPGPLTRITR